MSILPRRPWPAHWPIPDSPEPIAFDRRGLEPARVLPGADRLAPANARMELAQRFWNRFQPRVKVDAAGRIGFVEPGTKAPIKHPVGIKPELLWLARQAEAQAPGRGWAAYPPAGPGGAA